MPAPDPGQYETFADAYEAHAADAPYNALYDRPATLDLLGDVAGARMLDAGCGPGFYAAELMARGAEVVACDASPRMVELARDRTAGALDVRIHSLEDPLTWIDDERIDIALCALAYHYVTNRPGFLGEMHRVLRPGGSLVISTHHPTADWRHLGGSYFDTSTVTETWSKGWEVTTWRMPLTRMTAEFASAGLFIERLIEPQPVPAMAGSHPEVFERLSSEPGFIIFELRKPPVVGPR